MPQPVRSLSKPVRDASAAGLFEATQAPRAVRGLLGYATSLDTPRLVLWCYLIWYLSMLVRYFDPSLRLWLSSLGISAIIGTGLYLSAAHTGRLKTQLEPWQLGRLYLMPFCVSSFAALIKDRGFVLIFDPDWVANVGAIALCAAFILGVQITKRLCR
jgi:hypothetical protein